MNYVLYTPHCSLRLFGHTALASLFCLTNCYPFLIMKDLVLGTCVTQKLKIREADMSRLSFAVELAEEFYGRWIGRGKAGTNQGDSAKRMENMRITDPNQSLWKINAIE